MNASLKLWLWTACLGVLFGLIGLGELPEDLLRASRNSLHKSPASGDIVLVKLDSRSLAEVGRWPWPRHKSADMVNRLHQAGARSIFVDFMLDAPTTPAEDGALVEALRQAGNVTLAVLPDIGPDGQQGVRQSIVPLKLFADNAPVASVRVRYNYQNTVWQVPFVSAFDGKQIPTFSAKLAGRAGDPGDVFMPDYSIDPFSIPSVSVGDLLNGRVPRSALAGKDVVIGIATSEIGDELFVPGAGRMSGAYVHIIGAETLRSGTPRYFGWIPLFVASLALAAIALRQARPVRQGVIIGGGLIALLFGSAVPEAYLQTFDITPGLFVLAVVGSALGWRAYRRRGLVNPESGLANLNALRFASEGRDRALIAARVLNYEEIVSSFPQADEAQIIEQIVSRLMVGAPQRQLYHGDGGIFAWFEESRLPFANHLEALYAMFRNPARIDGRPIDLTVTFGVEIGSNQSLSNRLASALVAADDAAHAGLKWKYHDPETLLDASWKLSMLSQLDEAVDKGEVWVAYQPKLDLASRRIVGAEALARWTHPEKGPIAASEFIAAAEQHDRIGKLTDFILDEALNAAAQAARHQPGFGIAVNLSARLLTDRGFVLRLRSKLARNGIHAGQLTLELTETAALHENGSAIEMLASLCTLGVNISIDDYGTGLSTLEYLKKVPATEIKIDQSFVRGMVDNRSDRLMVQSTIALAHELGRTVVAEGIETKDILDTLTAMGCDIGQGFAIGRPMSLDMLVKRLGGKRKVSAA